jgi:hypothetical protein
MEWEATRPDEYPEIANDSWRGEVVDGFVVPQEVSYCYDLHECVRAMPS